jgi:hypothetical protein
MQVPRQREPPRLLCNALSLVLSGTFLSSSPNSSKQLHKSSGCLNGQ